MTAPRGGSGAAPESLSWPVEHLPAQPTPKTEIHFNMMVTLDTADLPALAKVLRCEPTPDEVEEYLEVYARDTIGLEVSLMIDTGRRRLKGD